MIRLHHTIAGDGHPVVFLHGFPFDGRMWAAQSAALAERHYTCIAPDLSGFGRSLTASPVHAIDDHAFDVNELLDQLHVDKAHLVGLSMGGYVALAFARRYSQRLASLVLANSKAVADSEENRAARNQSIAMIESKGASAYLDAFLPRLVASTASAATVAQVRAIAEAQPPATLVAAISAMRDRSDATDVLRSLDLPCLLISGAHDVLMPAEIALAMRQAQPDAELVTLQAGHLSPLEAPDAFNRTLLKFFESVRH